MKLNLNHLSQIKFHVKSQYLESQFNKLYKNNNYLSPNSAKKWKTLLQSDHQLQPDVNLDQSSESEKIKTRLPTLTPNSRIPHQKKIQTRLPTLKPTSKILNMMKILRQTPGVHVPVRFMFVCARLCKEKTRYFFIPVSKPSTGKCVQQTRNQLTWAQFRKQTQPVTFRTPTSRPVQIFPQ